LLNRRDSVTVYLRDAISPYTLKDSAKNLIDSISYSGSYEFSTAPSGTYYIVAKNLNGIETWSKAGGEVLKIGSTGSYDYTTSVSLAFGNNMKQVDTLPVRFAIFSGDVNQDGIIDATDNASIDNDATNFVTGYVNTDLTGDYVVDASDAAIADNNAYNFVTKITP